MELARPTTRQRGLRFVSGLRQRPGMLHPSAESGTAHKTGIVVLPLHPHSSDHRGVGLLMKSGRISGNEVFSSSCSPK